MYIYAHNIIQYHIYIIVQRLRFVPGFTLEGHNTFASRANPRPPCRHALPLLGSVLVCINKILLIKNIETPLSSTETHTSVKPNQSRDNQVAWFSQTKFSKLPVEFHPTREFSKLPVEFSNNPIERQVAWSSFNTIARSPAVPY